MLAFDRKKTFEGSDFALILMLKDRHYSSLSHESVTLFFSWSDHSYSYLLGTKWSWDWKTSAPKSFSNCREKDWTIHLIVVLWQFYCCFYWHSVAWIRLRSFSGIWVLLITDPWKSTRNVLSVSMTQFAQELHFRIISDNANFLSKVLWCLQVLSSSHIALIEV